MAWLVTHQTVLRLGCFSALLLLLMLAEHHWPRRRRRYSRWQRWPSNLGLVVLNSLVLRLLFPLTATGLALWAQQAGWGLLNQLPLPAAVSIALSVLLLDLLIYWQHRLFHRLPLLWRLHRVHHADPDYDVTTGNRFHPLEILLSMALKCLAILLLGVPPAAVVLFEVILNAMAMFNHSNLALPEKADRWLRRLLVTPDMHRVHHSILEREHHHNFGFNLAIWDRLFGSYLAQPDAGHLNMVIGLADCQEPEWNRRLDGMLRLPWRRPAATSRHVNR